MKASFKRFRPVFFGASIIACYFVWLGKTQVGLSINPLATEIDSLQQRVDSPDGRYVAKLLYRENLGMGYGYYRITLQPRGSIHFPTQVVEVAAEGLTDISWKNKGTLQVAYDASKDGKVDEETYFVQKPKTWRDLNLVYLPVH